MLTNEADKGKAPNNNIIIQKLLDISNFINISKYHFIFHIRHNHLIKASNYFILQNNFKLDKKKYTRINVSYGFSIVCSRVNTLKSSEYNV